MSQSLQLLVIAIFDSILVHLLNTVFSTDISTWQKLRSEICHNLNLKKNDRTLEILEQQCSDRDVIFMQEVADSFASLAFKQGRNTVNSNYYFFFPQTPSKSNQNSIIMLSKSRFPKADKIFRSYEFCEIII